jgi:hypothetical protein
MNKKESKRNEEKKRRRMEGEKRSMEPHPL